MVYALAVSLSCQRSLAAKDRPKKEKNPQLAMLKAMVRKRKLAGGSTTPMSGVSLSETEEGGGFMGASARCAQ